MESNSNGFQSLMGLSTLNVDESVIESITVTDTIDLTSATIVGIDTDDVAEGTNLYYTEGRVSSNTNVSANTTHRGIVTGNPHNVVPNDLGITDVGSGVIVSSAERTQISTNAGDILTNAGDISTNIAAIALNTAKISYPVADSTKVGFIAVTQAVDLDAMETDIATNNAKITYPSVDSTKVGFISVTQGVNLDTMETDIGVNNAKISYDGGSSAKVDFITVTQAVDLDTMETDIGVNASKVATNITNIATNVTNISTNTGNIATNITAIGLNTVKVSYDSGSSTKVGFLSVTQAVDLDTMESDITANNAKITYPSVDSTKLAGIEALADVTDATNVASAGALMRTGGSMSGAIEMGVNFINDCILIAGENKVAGTLSIQSNITNDGVVHILSDTNMNSKVLTGLTTPSGGTDAVNKTYADLMLPLAGGTMSGAIAMGTAKITGLGTPTATTDAATKAYADLFLPLTGGTLSGDLSITGALASGQTEIKIGSGSAASGGNGIAIGNSAGNVSLGADSVALGFEALNVGTGNNSVGIGYQALHAMSTGISNTGIGIRAGNSITTGFFNVCVGAESDCSAAASNQIAIGYIATSGGAGGIAIGNAANANGTSGIALGNTAGAGGTSGDYNIAIGETALGTGVKTIAATKNVCIGFESGKLITTADSNICIGDRAGDSITIKGNNICIGSQADASSQRAVCIGLQSTGVVDSTQIGAYANSTGTGYGIALGYNAAAVNNEFVFGGAGSASVATFRSGQAGCDLGTATYKFGDLHLSGDIAVDGTVDGRDVAADGSTIDLYLNQPVKTTSSPWFAEVSVGGAKIATGATNGLQVTGPSGNMGGGHIQCFTTSDNYPVFQQLNWSHNNIGLFFDSYYSNGWKSSSNGSNFAIYKVSNQLSFRYDSGITAGGAVTWNTGMVFTTAGRLGIGNSSPAYQLHLGSNSAAKPSSSTWTIYSDEKLKENIVDANLDTCWDNLKRLKLKHFKWKDAEIKRSKLEDKHNLGMTAQNVQTVFNKSVSTSKRLVNPEEKLDEMGNAEPIDTTEEEVLGVDYHQLFMCMMGVVQKLQIEVEELKTKNNELETKLDKIGDFLKK